MGHMESQSPVGLGGGVPHVGRRSVGQTWSWGVPWGTCGAAGLVWGWGWVWGAGCVGGAGLAQAHGGSCQGIFSGFINNMRSWGGRRGPGGDQAGGGGGGQMLQTRVEGSRDKPTPYPTEPPRIPMRRPTPHPPAASVPADPPAWPMSPSGLTLHISGVPPSPQVPCSPPLQGRHSALPSLSPLQPSLPAPRSAPGVSRPPHPTPPPPPRDHIQP